MSDSHYFILIEKSDQINKITSILTKCSWGWWGYGVDDNYQVFNLAALTPPYWISEKQLEKNSCKIYKFNLEPDNQNICVSPFIYPSSRNIIGFGDWREALIHFNNWIGNCVHSLKKSSNWSRSIAYVQREVL